jgi:hypothetical protein
MLLFFFSLLVQQLVWHPVNQSGVCGKIWELFFLLNKAVIFFPKNILYPGHVDDVWREAAAGILNCGVRPITCKCLVSKKLLKAVECCKKILKK